MNQKKLNWALALFSAVLILLFQNCSKLSTPLLFSKEDSSQSQTDGTGAHPYDGKIFSLFGELCSDGTQLQSRIVFNSSSTAELIRQNCQDMAPLALSASQYQVSADGTALTFNGQRFVATAPDAVGAGFGVLPKLNSPVDPTAYGAVGDGVTDNTAAFTAALNAGDILIPDGNYIIKGSIKIPAGRNIQCKSLSTVKIINPNTTTSGVHMFQFWSAGGSISNCRLSGANSFNPNGSATFDVNYQYNYLVSIVDYWRTVSNVTVSNNIFENCHGNACLTVYGSSGYGASNSQIVNNTFQNCGFYSTVIDGGSNILFSSNRTTDCSLGIEIYNSTDPNFNNVLEYNYLAVTHGPGRSYNLGQSSIYLTGGDNGFDYTSNIVRYNTVVGNGSAASAVILDRSATPAQYLNNTCINGCIVQ